MLTHTGPDDELNESSTSSPYAACIFPRALDYDFGMMARIAHVAYEGTRVVRGVRIAHCRLESKLAKPLANESL